MLPQANQMEEGPSQIQTSSSSTVNPDVATTSQGTTSSQAVDLQSHSNCQDSDIALYEELLAVLEDATFPLREDASKEEVGEACDDLQNSRPHSEAVLESLVDTISTSEQPNTEASTSHWDPSPSTPFEGATEDSTESLTTGAYSMGETGLNQVIPLPQAIVGSSTEAATSQAVNTASVPEYQGSEVSPPSPEDPPTWKLIPLDNPTFPLPDPRRLMWPTPSSDCCCRAARRVNMVKTAAKRWGATVFHREQRRQMYPLSVEYGELVEEAKLPDGSHYRVSYKGYRFPPFPNEDR